MGWGGGGQRCVNIDQEVGRNIVNIRPTKIGERMKLNQMWNCVVYRKYCTVKIIISKPIISGTGPYQAMPLKFSKSAGYWLISNLNVNRNFI